MFYLCRTIYSPLNIPWSLTHPCLCTSTRTQASGRQGLCSLHSCIPSVCHKADVGETWVMECVTSSPPLICPLPTLQLILCDSAQVYSSPILSRANYAPIVSLSTPLLKNWWPVSKLSSPIRVLSGDQRRCATCDYLGLGTSVALLWSFSS